MAHERYEVIWGVEKHLLLNPYVIRLTAVSSTFTHSIWYLQEQLQSLSQLEPASLAEVLGSRPDTLSLDFLLWLADKQAPSRNSMMLVLEAASFFQTAHAVCREAAAEGEYKRQLAALCQQLVSMREGFGEPQQLASQLTCSLTLSTCRVCFRLACAPAAQQSRRVRVSSSCRRMRSKLTAWTAQACSSWGPGGAC